MRKFVIFASVVLLILGLTVEPISAPDLEYSTIESCDSEGFTKDVFNPGEPVYLKVTDEGPEALLPSFPYVVYVVVDHEPWVPYPYPGYTELGDLTVVVGPLHAFTDMSGHFVGEPLLIWDSAAPGHYDIWVDNEILLMPGAYEEPPIDAVDNLDVDTAGFFVIPEVPLGSIAMLLACFTGLVIKRRKLF